MAPEVAQQTPANASLQDETPVTNGNHDQVMASDEGNSSAFQENATASKVDAPLEIPSALSADEQQQATESKPVEDVAPGISPVADFISKAAPTSHPTPPPDEPLVPSETNVDVEMTNPHIESKSDLEPASEAAPEFAPIDQAVSAPSLASEPDPIGSPHGATLVRPREDDGDDDEPVAKRSKLKRDPGEDPNQEGISAEMSAVALTNGTHAGNPQQQPAVVASGVNELVVPTSGSKPDVDVDMPAEQSANAPSAPPLDGTAPIQNGEIVAPAVKSSALDATAQTLVEQSAPIETESATDVAQSQAQSRTAPTSSLATASAPAPAPATVTTAAAPTKPYSKERMTQVQENFLKEKTKNLKKTKNSAFFLNPVDHVALNIPTYPDIIKNPMDLNTMEQKLKHGKYSTVQEYADDFNLIISNTQTFNGPNHAVTQAGMAMDAYFRKMMQSVPSTSVAAPQRTQQPKKASPKPAPAPRREARAVPPPAEAFALQSDGVPQIRRESTANRPARAIKPPPAKELTYAKPKRKEHQLELKFCDWALKEIRGNKYASSNSVFLAPVDPVALNIPHYRQVVKHPMDLGTMTQKLKQGQYAKASEVKRDFDLMIQNCLAFNPNGNVVRDMGISLQRDFEALWRTKEKWEKAERSAQRGNSSADEDESGEDEEEDDEDGAVDDSSAQTIAALQKQLMDMQNALAGLHKAPKTKKSKPAKSSHKKSGGAAAQKHKVAPSKPKKKTKLVTYDEKQEISEAVSNMTGPQVEELTRIITTNCKKYAEQEEMELEIDDLPNDVQAMLLQYVRSIFGNPNGARARGASPDEPVDEDDEFEPERTNKRGGGSAGPKRKKHKPMGKEEQQMAIDNIQKQLAQFQDGGAAIPPSNGYGGAGGTVAGDSSGDDDSEESEEE